MVDLVYVYLFFDIPVFYYYINLRSSITICIYFGDTYISSGISVRCLFLLLSTILLPIKHPVTDAAFSFALCETLSASIPDYLTWWKRFCVY